MYILLPLHEIYIHDSKGGKETKRLEIFKIAQEKNK